ncbi:MAG: hypothetical protein JWO44_2312 [Bacteroidetes bacterium]|nr:hypothetical protein [Bacteroidota bacterium]
MLKYTIADKYWEKKLVEKISVPALYRSGTAEFSSHDFMECSIPASALEGIDKITGKSKVAEYIYLLTAFGILLNKYVEDPESLVITTGSFHIEAGDDAVKNVLFLKTELSAGATVKEILNNFRQTFVEAYKHQEYSYTGLISKAESSNINTAAFFQFGFFNAGINYFPKETIDRLPLWVEVLADGSGSKFRFNYNTSFEKAFIEQLAAHYISLCTRIADEINVTLNDIELLTEKEKEIISQKYKAATGNPITESLVTAFASALESNPAATAVVFRDLTLSYDTLNKYSDAIACYLDEKCGISHGSIVALSLDSSVELMASLLAILKCGAAVLPIDISLPRLRIEHYLKDSGAAVLIGEEAWEDMPGIYSLPRTVLSSLMHEKKVYAYKKIAPSDIAYTIYTSGSTGASKAVKITHENIMSQFSWFKDHFAFVPSDVLPQKTTIGFVDSILELLFPITTGMSSTYLRPENETLSDLPEFITWLKKIKPTIIQFVPSVFDFIQTVTDLSAIKSLRALILTGEELKRTYSFPFPVYNIYGSSECSAYSLIYPLDGNEKGRIPIGIPTGNTQVYILGNNQEILPCFIAGEIYIGGDTVAAGYHNREELSNERFITDPFIPGKKMYKTGDYGRALPNGVIEYLGRKDSQLKIRGQRIEPGEIEFKISTHPAVSETIVWNSKDKNGEAVLSAFLILKHDKGFTIRRSMQLQKQHPASVKESYYLPNGLRIYPLNKRESELLYNEIFIDNSYIKNGIKINDNDVIFDVGANIGLFSLYVGLNYNNTKIYAFEPLPPIFDALQTNTSLYNVNTTLFNSGLGEKDADVEFSYYANNTALSGRYASEAVEKEVIRNYIKNDSGNDKPDFTERELDEVVNERISYTNFNCSIKRLSNIIRENNIERIDLLKIDVEKSELDVLYGIDPEHWNIIRQIVIEIHDIDSRGMLITEMLKAKGFSVIVEQETLFQNTGILNVYATREAANMSNPPEILQCNAGDLWTNEEALISRLNEICKSSLPGYMVPSCFKILDHFPRLSNGKINRNALAEMDLQLFLKSKNIILPRNSTEESILRIFTDVLKNKDLGINDDFFKNGGHSLNATQLTTRMVREMNAKINLKDVFDNPTVERLAHILNERGNNFFEDIVPLVQQNEYPVSFNQKRLWLASQMEDTNVAYNITGAYILEGKFDKAIFEKAVEQLIEKHQILRTVFINKDGIPFQKVLEMKDLLFKVKFKNIQELQNKNAAVTATIEEMRAVPFDLSASPLLRVTCVSIGPEKHLAILTIHHIISDGWSVKLMIQEVLSFYKESSLPLPPAPSATLAIQYKDYASWLNNMVLSGKLVKQKNFWMEKLQGKIASQALPYDHLPGTQPVSGSSFSFILEGSTFDSLKSLCETLNITPFIALLGAFKLLLSTESKQQNVMIGIPASGREHTKLDNQLGFYINLLPLLTVISPEHSYKQLLQALRESTLEIQQNQLFPLDLVLQELNFKRKEGQSGFINSGFTWNVNEEGTVLSDIFKIKPFPVAVTAVHHELWLIGDLYPSYIQFRIEYRSDLFKRASIVLLAEKFVSLLEQLITDPELPVYRHDMRRYADHLLKENELNIDIDI